MILFNRFNVEVIVDGACFIYRVKDIIDNEDFILSMPFIADPATVLENTLVDKINDKRNQKINQILNDRYQTKKNRTRKD